MQDETTDDVQVVVDIPSEGSDSLADYPIMMLFKRLLGNENKQNTVLTNAQILDILEKEFQVKTEELHELEMDIYLSIMKKFLKDWPQWDEFDSAIQELKNKKNHAETQKILLKKYHSLKSYLSVMLDIARPRAKDKVNEVEEKFNKSLKNTDAELEDLSDVVLEINSTRSQLNTLFFKHPHPEQNYTIFNANQAGPSKISLETPDYEAVLNWWNIGIIFKIQNLNIVRSTVHDVKHMLVNNKLKMKYKPSKLKSGYYERVYMKLPGTTFTKLQLVNILTAIYTKYNGTEYKPVLEMIYSVMEKDLNGFNSDLVDSMIYKKIFSKYPYVRYLLTEVPEAKNDRESMNYDLCLREEIAPAYQYEIIKVDPILSPTITDSDLRTIQVECKDCTLKFSGVTMFEQLKQHILENHMNEPDWQCTNAKCKKTITMVNLTKNRWSHECNA